MDCVRTAIRQGAASVACLYRRDRDNMPGSAREVLNAEEEGVVFEWLGAPKALMSRAARSPSVRAARMALSEPEFGKRREIVAVPGGDFDLPADLVIEALGFEPEALSPALTDGTTCPLTDWRDQPRRRRRRRRRGFADLAVPGVVRRRRRPSRGACPGRLGRPRRPGLRARRNRPLSADRATRRRSAA